MNQVVDDQRDLAIVWQLNGVHSVECTLFPLRYRHQTQIFHIDFNRAAFRDVIAQYAALQQTALSVAGQVPEAMRDEIKAAAGLYGRVYQLLGKLFGEVDTKHGHLMFEM